ncbi:MAG: alpha/beta hydrolase, partial [Atribacterota bacterium]|nr:alpha/beta hydrolase [Atribacterota bacterium]
MEVIRKKKKVSNPFYFSLIFNGNKERGNMFGNIKEGNILIGDSEMQYVVFGKGDRSLVIIPGLSDGIRTVKDTKLILWQQFRKFAICYKVWVFSRKNKLKPQMTTREMAEEQAMAMDKLEINKACIMGISQGGMIAQWMAIDYSQ